MVVVGVGVYCSVDDGGWGSWRVDGGAVVD
jgi:hypothetical protein